MRLRPHLERISKLLPALVVASALATSMRSGLAQEDLARPPRIENGQEPDPVPQTPAEEAAERASNDVLEEIVVISEQNPWRLPDLGSSWRAVQEPDTDTGRIAADLLPIWDPEEYEIPTRDPFAVGDAFRRVGYIELFRVRFRGR